MANPYTFGFLDQLVRINFPQEQDDFLCAVVGNIGTEMGRSLDGITWDSNAAPVVLANTNGAAYGNNVWIVNSGGDLYRSTDFALTWTKCFTGVDFFGAFDVCYIRPDTSTPGIFLAGRGNFLLLSTNLGVSWQTVGSGIGVDGLPEFGGKLVAGFSGVNNKFFATVNGNLEDFNDPRAYVYTSTNGVSWNGPYLLFSAVPLLFTGGPPPVANDQKALYVAYDSTSGKYAVIGSTFDEPIPGDSATKRQVLAVDTSSDGASWAGGTYFGGPTSMSGLLPRIAGGGGGFTIASASWESDTNSFASVYSVVTSLNGGSSWAPAEVFDDTFTPGAFQVPGSPRIAYSKKNKLFAVIFTVRTTAGLDGKVHIKTSPSGSDWTERSTDEITSSILTSTLPTIMTVGKLKA